MISVKKLLYKTIQKIASHTSTLSSHTSTLSSHTTQLGTVDSRIANKYVTESHSSSATSIAVNAVVDVQINVAKSGYTNLGIVQISKSGVANGHCLISGFYIDTSNKAHIMLKNTSSEAASVTVAVVVLHKKN